MPPSQEPREEVAALRERLSRLSEASRRINESLDFQTVLQGVLDSARDLTASQYGVITLFDPTGQVEDFLASGFTPEQARQIWEMPQGVPFFEYLRNLAQPLRVADFAGHAQAMGLPEFRPPTEVSAFLNAPIRHRGEVMGNICLARGQAGHEFSPEDEETLVMFASQVALVIANARRHREERAGPGRPGDAGQHRTGGRDWCWTAAPARCGPSTRKPDGSCDPCTHPAPPPSNCWR